MKTKEAFLEKGWKIDRLYNKIDTIFANCTIHLEYRSLSVEVNFRYVNFNYPRRGARKR